MAASDIKKALKIFHYLHPPDLQVAIYLSCHHDWLFLCMCLKSLTFYVGEWWCLRKWRVSPIKGGCREISCPSKSRGTHKVLSWSYRTSHIAHTMDSRDGLLREIQSFEANWELQLGSKRWLTSLWFVEKIHGQKMA